MKSYISKFASSMALSMIMTASAFASFDERIEALEKKMQEVSSINPQGTLGASFTTARPSIESNDLFLTFDLLYWHTKMGGTEYAYSTRHPIDSPNKFPLEGDTKDNSFCWDFGIKTGLGYKTAHDDWDIFARYTWYDTHSTSSSSKSAPSTLVSLTYISNLTASKAKSHVNVNYNNLDVELGRSYFISNKLALRTHIDLKTSWIDVNNNVVYTISDASTNEREFVGLDYKSKERVHFWGIGPRIGLDTKRFLNYGFHVFGDIAASILYGYFDTSQRNFAPPHSVSNNANDGIVFKMKSKFHRYVPFTQMLVGLGWNTSLNSNKQYLTLKLGYEAQYYWRVNQAQQPESSYRTQFKNQSEDLMFYGVTGEARLDF